MKGKLVDEEDYEEDVLVASITLGTLPLEIAGGIGKRIGGWKGMLVSSAGMALLGVILTIVLLAVMPTLNATIGAQIGAVTHI